MSIATAVLARTGIMRMRMVEKRKKMEIKAFLIVCPLVFLAGFIDAIGGGGGLISLPAYVLAGLPVHQAVATNKLSGATGTLISTLRLCRHGRLNLSLILPAIVLAVSGATAGSKLSLYVEERILKQMLLIVLPVVAFFVLRKNSFAAAKEQSGSKAKTFLVSWTAALLIGLYDGFYGPGTGTFYMIVFMAFAHMSSMDAAVNTKILNLTSNLTSLIVFLWHGECVFLLGICASLFSIAGNYLGAGMVLKNGSKAIRPVILFVLLLLFLKVLTEL